MSSIKVTIIGAGSVVFSLGLVKDLCLTKSLAGSTVCFIDINEERLDVIYRLAGRYAEDLGAKLSFQRSKNRQESLQEADFVINTATVVRDEALKKRRRELTARLGYFFDHTGMPDFYDLQLMLDVARDVEVICPDAWILQAGNPVFQGTTLMNRETDAKVCGLCHGHYGYRTIARVLGLDPEKTICQAPGLNHEIWMTHFLYEGQDAYPLLDEWIANKAEGYWAEAESNGKDIPAQMSRAAIHQYKMYGLMPIGDTPRTGGWWYHTDLETRKRWYGGAGGGDTPAGRDRILENKAQKFAQMKQAAYNTKTRPIDLFGNQKTTEQHVPIMDALTNNHEGQFQVNMPNKGALQGLPEDVAVETPAIVNAKGIQQLCVGSLPAKIMLERIYPVWLDMERALEALLSGDKSMLLYGILQSHQTHSYDQAVETLEALMAIEPNEAMRSMEGINDHYAWPDNWKKESR